VAVTQYTFTNKLYVDVLTHLLTVFGLKTCGSNTVHIYKKLFVNVLIRLLTAVGFVTDWQ